MLYEKIVSNESIFAELYFYCHPVFDKIRLIIAENRLLPLIFYGFLLFFRGQSKCLAYQFFVSCDSIIDFLLRPAFFIK